MDTKELTLAEIAEIIENPKACLDKSLNALKIVVDAQPKVANQPFFEAIKNFRDIRNIAADNNLLPNNEIRKYDETCHMYITG